MSLFLNPVIENLNNVSIHFKTTLTPVKIFSSALERSNKKYAPKTI